VRAVAAAAASGDATYAVRKALAARDGSDEDQRDEVEAKQEDPEDSADEDDKDSAEDEPEASADEGDEDAAEEKAEASADEGDEDSDEEKPEASADEGDEDSEEEKPEASADEDDEESGSSDGKGALLRLVNPSRLAGASDLLLPLAASAADSAGRYVAEHTSDTVQQEVVDRFVDAYKKAS
jgi:hypothetical protein